MLLLVHREVPRVNDPSHETQAFSSIFKLVPPTPPCSPQASSDNDAPVSTAPSGSKKIEIARNPSTAEQLRLAPSIRRMTSVVCRGNAIETAPSDN